MTKLSVNINKIALIRNSRGENNPNLLAFAQKCVEYGADGITIHPRPDQRHIRIADAYHLKEHLKNVELNIEGYPTQDFIKMVCEIKPAQVTLVPDAPQALTSNSGWDTITHATFLKEVISEFKKENIRVSLFMNPDPYLIQKAAETQTDRIELYTGPYAKFYPYNPEKAIEEYLVACTEAIYHKMGINAGHDLNTENLGFLKYNLAKLDEVSIGHALISDSLIWGIEKTILNYKQLLHL